MGTLTILNIASISIACDHGIGWKGWYIIDAIFCGVFALEILIKLGILGIWAYWRSIKEN